jgi:hypothetical protein
VSLAGSTVGVAATSAVGVAICAAGEGVAPSGSQAASIRLATSTRDNNVNSLWLSIFFSSPPQKQPAIKSPV